MVYSNQPYARRPIGIGFGERPSKDVVALLVVLFVTYSLQFFDRTRLLLEPLRLSPDVWQRGFVWQLVTYPFVSAAVGPIWFLIELLILFWFGRDVFRYLGRRPFWLLLAWGVITASLVAVGFQLLTSLAGAQAGETLMLFPFPILQGQRILLVILIAAFATVYGNATIYFMFILPIRARWFLWLELVFAFMAFLTTKDLAGFLGVAAAVGVIYSLLTPGGLNRILREWRIRGQRVLLSARMRRMRKRRDFRIVDDDDDDNVHHGPWIN